MHRERRGRAFFPLNKLQTLYYDVVFFAIMPTITAQHFKITYTIKKLRVLPGGEDRPWVWGGSGNGRLAGQALLWVQGGAQDPIFGNKDAGRPSSSLSNVGSLCGKHEEIGASRQHNIGGDTGQCKSRDGLSSMALSEMTVVGWLQVLSYIVEGLLWATVSVSGLLY